MPMIGTARLVSTLLLVVALACSSPVSAQNSREQREQPEKLLDAAGVKPGMSVGEAGAGDGFLTFFLSKRVGASGRVYANDIDTTSLDRLKDRARQEGAANIATVLGKIDDPLYPVKDLDLITMIYAFHDFTERVAWLRNARRYLKEDAGIFIFDGQAAHFSREIVERDADQAGFRLVRAEVVHGKVWLYELRLKQGA